MKPDKTAVEVANDEIVLDQDNACLCIKDNKGIEANLAKKAGLKTQDVKNIGSFFIINVWHEFSKEIKRFTWLGLFFLFLLCRVWRWCGWGGGLGWCGL
jgi:hypothetical protein